MDGEQRDAEGGRGAHGARHGVRDVVEFEIEEYTLAASDEVADNRWASGGEKLFAYL